MGKKDIIQALIDHYTDGNLTKFASKLGVKPQTIVGWKTRDSLDYDLVYERCENLSAEWLLSGEGSMTKDQRQQHPDEAVSNQFIERLFRTIAEKDELIRDLERENGQLRERVATLSGNTSSEKRQAV